MNQETPTQTHHTGQYGPPETPSKKTFFIFGHNISHTLSPTLHNTGFRELGLPFHYDIHQTPGVDATVQEIIRRDEFGGASVTFPHKLQIGRLLDSVSPFAQRIGAVNTIVVDVDVGSGKVKRHLRGENTDWHGIKRCIQRSGISGLELSSALILGAGGAARAACFAVQSLGISEVLIVNRTVAKARDMGAEFFRPEHVGVFATLQDAMEDEGQNARGPRAPIRVVVACVPADDLTADKVPTKLFSKAASGVLVEMAYRPQVTGMMSVASAHGGWQVCRGVDVLEEQAYAQFELWTGRDAPVEAMRAAMRAKIEEHKVF